jgi:hypothetical protein
MSPELQIDMHMAFGTFRDPRDAQGGQVLDQIARQSGDG